MRTSMPSATLCMMASLLCCGYASYAPYPHDPAGAVSSVVEDPAGDMSLVSGRQPHAIAWGSLSGSLNKTGTTLLNVHSAASAAGTKQAFAAGYLEGALTADLIWMHYNNNWNADGFVTDYNATFPVAPPLLAKFAEDNVAWMREGAAAHEGRVALQNDGTVSNSTYWQHIGYIVQQLDGMTAGFNAHLPADAKARGFKGFTSPQLMMLTLLDGDMDDIAPAISPPKQKHATVLEIKRKQKHHTRCSALVQLTPDQRELMVAHVNWDDYEAMLRIVKYFDLPLPGVAATGVSMDSYPGGLSSMSDWYRTSAGLTATETSLDLDNPKKHALITPKSIMTFARGVIANRLAPDADTWTEVNLRYQSGTCNNQWIVVDFKRFTPGQSLPSGTVYVSETMPGVGTRADVTPAINGGARGWFSYNIPYFTEISIAGGYLPPQHEYLNAPRANMWRRESKSGALTDLKSFVSFMRYNNRTDPLAKGDACNGISCRCDLNPPASDRYDCFGAIDIKFATSATGLRSGTCQTDSDCPGSYCVNDATKPPPYVCHGSGNNGTLLDFFGSFSPSWEGAGGTNPPFAWSDQGRACSKHGVPHAGQPDVFNFPIYHFPSVVA